MRGLLAVLLLPAAAAFLTRAAPASAETLLVSVSGAGGGGQIVVSLFARPEGFSGFDRALAFRSVAAPATGAPVAIRFDNIPPGQYALAAFHDADADGKLRRNFIGIPREAVGVSNNPGGMPKFERSLVTVPTKGAIDIKLRRLGD